MRGRPHVEAALRRPIAALPATAERLARAADRVRTFAGSVLYEPWAARPLETATRGGFCSKTGRFLPQRTA